MKLLASSGERCTAGRSSRLRRSNSSSVPNSCSNNATALCFAGADFISSWEISTLVCPIVRSRKQSPVLDLNDKHLWFKFSQADIPVLEVVQTMQCLAAPSPYGQHPQQAYKLLRAALSTELCSLDPVEIHALWTKSTYTIYLSTVWILNQRNNYYHNDMVADVAPMRSSLAQHLKPTTP